MFGNTPAPPQRSDSLLPLAEAARAEGRFAEAVALGERAVRERPTDVAGYLSLAQTLEAMQCWDEALQLYAAANQLRPTAAAWNNGGRIHAAQGRWNDAIVHYRAAVALDEGHPDIWRNLGNALVEQGDFGAAQEAYARATTLRPDDPETENARGILLRRQGRPGQAVVHFAQAVIREPRHHGARTNLAASHWECGDVTAALTEYETLYQAGAATAQAHSDYLVALNYLAPLNLAANFERHRDWARRHTVDVAVTTRHPHVADANRPLRVGYLSPDFREHSVAYFFEPVLASHDRAQFTTFCYDNSRRHDATTQRLRRAAHAWREIADLGDDAVTAMIREDRIDILVDLAGHTAGHRLRVFAARPAPVQATYLGYFNTTGLPTVDYRFTDAWADPSGYEAYYSEQLVRLEAGFSCYRPPDEAPPCNALPETACGHLTFGSFNQLAKITPEVVTVWATVLRAAPTARLRLKAKMLGDPAVQARYRRLFAAQGIDDARLELLGPDRSTADHLRAYYDIDIALDTFPLCGATTTAEALWMGVPTLTLAGNHHAGRVGVSMLTRVGLTEWIATSADDYIERAIQLASRRETLAMLRRTLRERMHETLCAPLPVTRAIEVAYRRMWRTWCQHPRIG